MSRDKEISGSEQAAARLRRERLRWGCRRGMRELDELLLGFIDKQYAELTEQELRAFEALLGYQDPLLLEILMLRVTPTEGDMADVVRKIRASA